MRNLTRRLAIVIGLGLALAGCDDQPGPGFGSATLGASPYRRGDLGSLTYRAVDLMLAQAPELTAGAPLVVATVADAQYLETSSPLDNIVADMIRTRLVQDGHATSDIRLRSAVIFGKNEGEFVLSRNRRALMPPPIAAAIATGTYAESYDKVYVSLKLLSAVDAHIIEAADFVVPAGEVEGPLAPPRV